MRFSRRPACYNTDTMSESRYRYFSLVSVEDLHVIILIPIQKNGTTVKIFSFSRRPACYNTDTLLPQLTTARSQLVSVEDLHVIILILFAEKTTRRNSSSFSRRPACYNTDTFLRIGDKKTCKFQSKTCML